MLAKRLPPLHYSNLAASDTKKRPNLRQTLRKSAQIPPYGYIAAIGQVASAEQACAVVVDTNDITSGSITPDIDETLIDLSSLDVSGFTPDTTNLYASIIDVSGGSTATIWNSATSQLVSGITVANSFGSITGTFGADSMKGSDESDTIKGGDGDDRLAGGDRWDTLNGGAGNDTLYGHTFSDTLNGGTGADTFVIAVDGNSNSGSNTITDFDVTATTGDKVQIDWRETADAPADFAAAGLALGTDTDGNAILADSTDTSIIYLTFEGIAQADLVEATHFEFV